MQSFDDVVLQGHVTNKKYYISTTRMPVATKPARMMIYIDRLLLIKPHNHLITWTCDIAGLLRGGSARKRLNRHRFLVEFSSTSFS